MISIYLIIFILCIPIFFIKAIDVKKRIVIYCISAISLIFITTIFISALGDEPGEGSKVVRDGVKTTSKKKSSKVSVMEEELI